MDDYSHFSAVGTRILAEHYREMSGGRVTGCHREPQRRLNSVPVMRRDGAR